MSRDTDGALSCGVQKYIYVQEQIHWTLSHIRHRTARRYQRQLPATCACTWVFFAPLIPSSRHHANFFIPASRSKSTRWLLMSFFAPYIVDNVESTGERLCKKFERKLFFLRRFYWDYLSVTRASNSHDRVVLQKAPLPSACFSFQTIYISDLHRK